MIAITEMERRDAPSFEASAVTEGRVVDRGALFESDGSTVKRNGIMDVENREIVVASAEVGKAGAALVAVGDGERLVGELVSS
jgi:hypothetical protein